MRSREPAQRKGQEGKSGAEPAAPGATPESFVVPECDALGRRTRREPQALKRFLVWRAAQPKLPPLWVTCELQRIVCAFCRRQRLSDNAVSIATGIPQPTVAKALRGRGEGVCHTLDLLIIRLGIDPEVVAKLLLIRARALKRAKG